MRHLVKYRSDALQGMIAANKIERMWCAEPEYRSIILFHAMATAIGNWETG